MGKAVQPVQIEGAYRLDFASRDRKLDTPFRHEKNPETSCELAGLAQRHIRHAALNTEPAAGNTYAADELLIRDLASLRER